MAHFSTMHYSITLQFDQQSMRLLVVKQLAHFPCFPQIFIRFTANLLLVTRLPIVVVVLRIIHSSIRYLLEVPLLF